MEEPFILKSEHTRILSSAQQRYDRARLDALKIGFWRGVASVVWLSAIGAVFLAVAAFSFGVNVQLP
jgi:hypothetical protein